MNIENGIWIKTHLHKDGTAQWHGVQGDQQTVINKLNELRSSGYSPIIDHDLNDPKPKFYTILHAEDGNYVKPHSTYENARQHVKFQLGEQAGRGTFGWFDDWGRSMAIIDMEDPCPETLEEMDRCFIDTSGNDSPEALTQQDQSAEGCNHVS
jgi:hypothetical protein